MNLKRILVTVAAVIAEEAAQNPDFQASLEDALTGRKPSSVRLSSSSHSSSAWRLPDSERKDVAKRRGGRRDPAVLDPIALAVHGEVGLREQLRGLSLEQLHNIVAQYGMDPGKLVMKWRDQDRVIERILEVALARATKGDAFRKE